MSLLCQLTSTLTRELTTSRNNMQEKPENNGIMELFRVGSSGGQLFEVTLLSVVNGLAFWLCMLSSTYLGRVQPKIFDKVCEPKNLYLQINPRPLQLDLLFLGPNQPLIFSTK